MDMEKPEVRVIGERLKNPNQKFTAVGKKRFMKFENKVAIITGASRGIGAAIATAFAAEGCKIIGVYNNNSQAMQKVADSIHAAGGKVLAIQANVGDRKEVKRIITLSLRNYGRIDILVNNAGILQQKPFELIKDEEWDTTFQVCLKGPFMLTQEVHPIFKVQKSGRIINIASIGGQFGGPKAPHYAAAKAGLICFTKSTARIFSPFGATANCISPGFIQTDMSANEIDQMGGLEAVAQTIPVRRIGIPTDVASAAVYLASDEASYITGCVLNVNGGQFML